MSLRDWSSDVCSSDLCVCRRADETALAILWAGSDPLSPGAFGQDDSLHAASGAVLDFMVAEEAHQLEESFPDRSLPRSWHRHGFISDVVGALSPGDESSHFYVPEPNRAGPRRKPGCLVLPE